jgi:octaprenyl-diphosphate synthase
MEQDRSTNTLAHLVTVYSPIGEEMERLSEFLADEFASKEPYIYTILQHISQFRGKQLRPALLFLFNRLARGAVQPDLIKIGSVLEMIHTATLVHDDLLDDARIRRQVETVHVRWGDRAAILMGDYIYSRAFHLSTEVEGMAHVLSRATNLVCEGELLQIGHRFVPRLDESVYFEIIRKKTAILHAVACELGGRFAGLDESICRRFSDYGMDVGIAFQIIDDCLDLEGDEEIVGKSLGTDLRQGKMTLPLLYLRDRLPDADRIWFDDALSRPVTSEAERRIRRWIFDYGVLPDSLARAVHFVERAKDALASGVEAIVRQDGPRRVDQDIAASLSRAADFVLQRKK